MEIFSQEIIDNIKHEPEIHFLLTLPADPEYKLKSFSFKIKRFDQRWTYKANWFDLFYACDNYNNCQYVSKKKNLRDFMRHQKNCWNRKTFQCDHCEKNFPQKTILMFHMNKHRQKRTEPLKFPCEYCGQVFKGKSGLKQHLRHKGVNNCMLCDEKFICLFSQLKHEIENHKVGDGWKCRQCPFIATEKVVTKRHQQTHDKTFSCETCKKKFSLKTTLKLHQTNHRHGIFKLAPTTKFECDICGKSKSSKFYLLQHMTTQHRDQKLKCKVCLKIFKYKKILNNHIQIHNKIQCPICSKKITKKQLNNHVKAHSAGKSIKCKFCHLKLSNKSSFKNHMRFYCPNNPERVKRRIYS